MRNILLITALFIIGACTGTQNVTVDDTETKKSPAVASTVGTKGCETFANYSSPDAATKMHVLYRDLVKAKQYDDALPLWEKAYNSAPAANGATAIVYKDGVKIYKHLYKNATSDADKAKYQAKILELYDAHINCYSKDENDVLARKIRALYYDFEDKSNILALGKRALEVGGTDISPAVFYAYADVVATSFMAEKLTKAEAIDVYNKLNKAAMHNMANAKDEKTKESYRKAWDDASGRYELIGAYVFDCQRYVDMYQADFDANPSQQAAVDLIPKLSVKGCSKTNPFYAKVYQMAYPPRVVTTTTTRPTSTSTSSGGGTAGMSPTEKVAYYEGKMADPGIDDSKKFSYALNAANISYSKLGQKSKGRSLARKAAKYNPSSGKPYLVIGKIYAGSGKDCGPGTGFDSQRVVWPAIDQWKKAISVAPGSAEAGEAQDLINKYNQYLPSCEDVFMLGKKNGDSYTVPCWINETTRVRCK